MTPFAELIITFGATRSKELNEGLNDKERDLINSLDLKTQTHDFIFDYCKANNVKPIHIAEHNDEKLKHYQVIVENYVFSTHKCLCWKKDEFAKFGSKLQDMVASAFDGITVRGVKGSLAWHKTLKEMHRAEELYNSRQEFEHKISCEIKEFVSLYIDKKKSMIWGREYYELSNEKFDEFVTDLQKVVIESLEERVVILSSESMQKDIDMLKQSILSRENIVKEAERILKEYYQSEQKMIGLEDIIKQKDVDMETIKRSVIGDSDIVSLKASVIEGQKSIDRLQNTNNSLVNEIAQQNERLL